MSFDRVLELIEAIDGAELDLGSSGPAYLDFSIDEYRRRYARLGALMDDAGIEALFFTQEEPVRYLTGYTSVIWAVGRWLPGGFLATRDPRDAVLIPSAFDVGAASGTSWVTTIDGHEGPADLVKRLDAHLTRLGIDRSKVAIERDTGSVMMLSLDAAMAVSGLFPAGAPDAMSVISTLRMLKSPAEIERVRSIVRATVAGYAAGVHAAHEGMTEKELVSIVASKMYASGATAGTRPLFLNCVAGPDRYPLVDTSASDRPFRPGDVVFIDGGGGGDGYMSDIIRLIGIGDLSDQQLAWADVASDATQAMVDAVRPGLTATQLFETGHAVIESSGLGEWAGGLSGHGIGMEIWERPFLRRHTDPTEDITLRAGMTLCIEPMVLPVVDGQLQGIYVFEQQVAVTEDGCDVLSDGLDARLWRAK